jgi:NADH-quinone oxidoreductase subunit L
MHDEQDIRKMGGIWKKIPITYTVFWAGSLALAGVFPFAGYFSKDAIINATWASGTAIGQYGFWCTLLAAFLTAFYSWRLIIVTFHGAPRADHHTMEHVHESPLVMTVPLMVLAVGALVTGFVFHDQILGADWRAFWGNSIQINPINHVLALSEELPALIEYAPSVVGLLGIALAYVMYMALPTLPGRLANTVPAVYRFVLNKWYFDELYNAVIIQPFMAMARVLWQVGDATIIDGIPNGIAELTSEGSTQVVKIQTGSIAVYAFTMLIGLVVLVGIYMVFR